jgi:signal transduction histidine kinase/CHASE1-domain containing sensor protein
MRAPALRTGNPLVRLTAGIVLLAGVYALFGWLIHLPEQIGGTSIYAAPIWLPAGFALGALIVYGRSLWPGIWLGQFAGIFSHLLPQAGPTPAIIAASLIASGAVLQALLGLALTHRFIGRQPALDNGPEVLRFIILCGPLASLLNATIGSLTFSAFTGKGIAGLLLEWLAWWSGDTIGVLFGTPIVLAIAANPRSIWRPRRLTVALPLIFAAVLTTAFFYTIGRLEHENRQTEFKRHAELLANTVQSAFASANEAARSLADYFNASERVDAHEFTRFASSLHQRHPDLQALEWAPRITHVERDAYESSLRSRDEAHSGIHAIGPGGNSIPARQHEEYFPVHYAYPRTGNERAIGLDLGSDVQRREALDAARKSGYLSVSGRVQLVQEDSQQSAILAIAPVLAADRNAGRSTESIAGYAIAVMHIADVLDLALKPLLYKDVAYRLTDLDAAPTMRLLHEAGQFAGAPLYGHTRDFDFGGRRWHLDIRAGENYRFTHRAGSAWVMLAGGVAVSALLSFFLLILSGRTARTEQLVKERTAELDSARAAAEKVRQLLEEAVGSIAQGFTIYDENDRLVVCNEAYKSFYETSRDLIVPGTTFEEIVRRGAERGQYAAALGDVDAWVKARVAQHQSADGRVIEQRLGDGRWLLIVEHRTPSGYIVGNRIDITELKRTAAALGDRNAQLDAIFQLSPDGLVSFDLAGHVKSVNAAFTRMTGLPAAAVSGRSQAELEGQLRALAEHPEQWPGLEASFHTAKVGAGGTATSSTEPHLLALQRPRAAVLELVGVTSTAASVSRLLYLRDVTHEVEVDRMKSEFLSHAAHELRTPMASIFGFTELLMTQEFDEATRKDLLATIYKQTAWLVDIINELLDLARIESRRGKDFSIAAVALDACVADVLGTLSIDAERWPIIVEVADDLPPALADAAKLRQAITNVLGNAVKYSPAGGTLSIRGVTRVSDDRPQVGLIIADHGIGMTPEQVSHVGERFYRADSSGNIPGTGLGMAIVKEILDLLGGSFTVVSTPGTGTTVSLWLPVAQTDQTPTESTAT